MFPYRQTAPRKSHCESLRRLARSEASSELRLPSAISRSEENNQLHITFLLNERRSGQTHLKLTLLSVGLQASWKMCGVSFWLEPEHWTWPIILGRSRQQNHWTHVDRVGGGLPVQLPLKLWVRHTNHSFLFKGTHRVPRIAQLHLTVLKLHYDTNHTHRLHNLADLSAFRSCSSPSCLQLRVSKHFFGKNVKHPSYLNSATDNKSTLCIPDKFVTYRRNLYRSLPMSPHTIPQRNSIISNGPLVESRWPFFVLTDLTPLHCYVSMSTSLYH